MLIPIKARVIENLMQKLKYIHLVMPDDNFPEAGAKNGVLRFFSSGEEKPSP